MPGLHSPSSHPFVTYWTCLLQNSVYSCFQLFCLFFDTCFCNSNSAFSCWFIFFIFTIEQCSSVSSVLIHCISCWIIRLVPFCTCFHPNSFILVSLSLFVLQYHHLLCSNSVNSSFIARLYFWSTLSSIYLILFAAFGYSSAVFIQSHYWQRLQ